MGAARAETGANRGMNVGRKPAWNGRFRHGSPETPVNIGLAGRLPGDARFTRGSGQACGGYCVGCRSSVPVVGRNPASIGRLRVGWLEMPVNTGLAGRRVFCDAASATSFLLSVTGIAICQ